MKTTLVYPSRLSEEYTIAQRIKDFHRAGSFWLPLGLAYIGAVLKKNNFDISAIDMRFLKTRDEFARRVKKENTDIVGIYTNSINYDAVLEIAKQVKNISDAFIISGGPQPSILPEQTLENETIDAVVVGEGELTTLEAVSALERGKSLEGIKGIWFKEEGRIRKNEGRDPIEDLDSLPFPERDLFPIKEILKKPQLSPLNYPSLHIMGSRGCMYGCSFCQPTLRCIFGNKPRFRSADNIISEMEMLKEKYGIRSIVFQDDTFTEDKPLVLEFCKKLKEKGLDIPWWCHSRANTIDEEIAKEMKSAGCSVVCFGLESGSQRILDSILTKGITVEQSINAGRICKKNKIVITADIMIGSPTETKEDIMLTEKMLNEIKPEVVSVSVASPIPGTYLYEKVKKEGLILARKSADFDRVALEKMRLEHLTKDDLLSFRKRIGHDFSLPLFLKEGYYARLCLRRWLSHLKNLKGVLIILEILS